LPGGAVAPPYHEQRFQICEEIIIARRRGSAKLLVNLTKEKL
jgi:hypothetical protein